MKKFNYSRILILVLSLALLIGAAFAVTANAEEAVETPATLFKGISVAYGDNVAIIVAVNATQEEIESRDIRVTYTLGEDSTEYDAKYYYTDANNVVWVRTSGIEAYKLAQVVKFNSYVGETKVDTEKAYSVAQFLYTMLYTEDLSEVEENLYNALLTYGEATQKWYNAKNDLDLPLVTASSLVYTNNANVKINGNGKVFAPAKEVTVTLSCNEIPQFKLLEGWNIIHNGEAKVLSNDESFTLSGIVEVVSPVFVDQDPTPFTLANGGFENGLEGWTLVGNIGGISSDKNYWVNDSESAEGFAFGMDGEKMFSAYVEGADEKNVGTLTSSSFIVGGTGYVTFKLGAMKDGRYVYVDVVDAETKQILARYYNGLWADRTEGVKSGCTLVSYKADLSEFKGKSVFFRLSDNADSDYGLFFADSFNTYHTTVPGAEYNTATPVDYTVSGTIYDLFNGGFEMGNLAGWLNPGEPGAVTGADAFFSGVAYGKEGTYLYSGVEDHGAGNGREGNKGTLTSSAFEIGGAGYITYMLGGGNELCYVQVIDSTTGEILARFRQQAREDAVLKSYVADLTAYVGRTVRIQVVDNATSNWGCVSFDNVKTYYASKPEGFIDAVDVKHELVNGSFENGLDGWTMNITEAGAHNTLGWVLDSEIDADWYTKNDDRKDGNNIFTFAKPNGDNCENTKGTLNSATFVLKKDSYVSFRFGGAGTSDVHIQLCKANGEVIATFYNKAEGKINTEMFAYYYQYTGETTECFFRVVDNSTGNYGCFVVDDFRANLESAPGGFIAAIQ